MPERERLADWQLKVTPISSVQRRAVEWLWPGRIPLGKLTLLEGDPSVGKSYLTLAVATAVAAGAPFPLAGERREPGRTLLLAAEDGLADTVAPRLDAMGADTSRIEAIEAAVRYVPPAELGAYSKAEIDGREAVDDEQQRAIFLTEDLERLDRILCGRLYRLLVIDPINAYIPASVDTGKDNAVRSVLAPLVMMADRYRVAVLAVRHLTKGSRDKAIYRGQGSIGYTAAARSVLLAGRELNNGGRRLLMQIKPNLSGEVDPVTFTIDDGRFAWGSAAPGVQPSAVLGVEPEQEQRTGTAEAGDLLVDFLSEGDQPAAECQKYVRQRLGCSMRTVERAKYERHIASQRRGFGRQSEIYWHLPGAFQPTLIEGGVSKGNNAEGDNRSKNLQPEAPIGAKTPSKATMAPMGENVLGQVTPGVSSMASMQPAQGGSLDDPSLEQLINLAAATGPPEDWAELDDD